jgi:hypothetical protein
VFHTLSKEFGLGTVEVNGPIQGEYAFDIWHQIVSGI